MKTLGIIIIILVVIGLIVAGIAVFSNNANESDADDGNNGVINVPDNIDNTNTNNNENNTNSPKTYSVEIKSFAFNPATLTIKIGDSITWTNKDSVKHTVTSDSGNELDSELLSQNEVYTHTFNSAGTFNYHCTPHPYMKAKIVVE